MKPSTGVTTADNHPIVAMITMLTEKENIILSLCPMFTSVAFRNICKGSPFKARDILQ